MSSFKQLLSFQLPGQIGSSLILEDSALIRITMPGNTVNFNLRPERIQVSNFARLSPDSTLARDFSDTLTYDVLAEDGSKKTYTILVEVESSTPQLIHSDFNTWYTANYSSGTCQELGSSATSTIWASGNEGVLTFSLANTSPENLGNANYAVRLETKDLGSLAAIAGTRMAAGSIFTGDFVLNIANPTASPVFGIEYTKKPISFTIDYKYAPGTPYKDGQGNTIAGGLDSCDIYLLLEDRSNPNSIKRIATANFRTGATVTTWTSTTVDLIYGALPNNYYSNMFPSNNLYGSATDTPTHITFVATSSAQGFFFKGGVGSVLQVDNLRLNY